MRYPLFCHLGRTRKPRQGRQNTTIRTSCTSIRKEGPAKSLRTPKGAPDHSPGLRLTGATPGRRICLKPSPERAAQTPAMAEFCATLSGLTPKGVPARRRRDGHQPQAVLRSPFRAIPNGNSMMWDFLPLHQKRWPGTKKRPPALRQEAFGGCRFQSGGA